MSLIEDEGQNGATRPIVLIHEARFLNIRDHQEDIRQWMASANVVIVVESGHGTLLLDRLPHVLSQGDVFLFVPEKRCELRIEIRQALMCYVIAFDFYRPQRSATGRDMTAGMICLTRAEARLPRPGRIRHNYKEDIMRLAAQMVMHDEELGTARSPLVHQARLYELLHDLLDADESGYEERRLNGIEESLHYMQAHYHEPITRERLANIAGMSIWHYSDVFKRHVGKSPLHYLNDMRIDHAKKDLVSTNRLVKEIARQVGFADEYYFSRKFKQATGVSPNVFRNKSRAKIAALSFPYTGNLLALGTVPFAAVMDQQRDFHRQPYFADIPYQLRRSETLRKEVIEYNLNALSQADPGLILCSEVEERVLRSYDLKGELPLFVIPWLQLDWRSQFKQIASLLGKEREALSWLAGYDAKAAKAARLLGRRIGTATVSVLHVKEGGVYVYGKRNAGSVLYEDLRLLPAYRYQDIEVCRPVRPDEMHDYLGDYVFVMIERSAASRRSWEACKQLEMIRQRQVFELDEMPWLDYSAYAHNLIIDETLRLFDCPAIPLMYKS